MHSALEILQNAMDKDVSDILIITGFPVAYKINGRVTCVGENKLMPDDTCRIISEIYDLGKKSNITHLQEHGDDDFSFTVPKLGRFRCNTYKQRDSMSAVLRVVRFKLPSPDLLNIPEDVLKLSDRQKGLILVTGQAGSGKSTTLACMIDRINHSREGHIITLEDPIEYLHPHNKSIVSQREINHDTEGYDTALRAALRQSPDVILMGEMRDFETIRTVITAAETGQLVLSTLHTVGAAKTIDRIIDVFPPNQQQQIRFQLAMVIEAVISQRLIPSLDGKLVPAFEIMVTTPAIKNMIRESKVHQMDNVLYAGGSHGMRTLDMDILRLFNEKVISRENAIAYSSSPEMMAKKLAAQV